jgi:hypothetical protein
MEPRREESKEVMFDVGEVGTERDWHLVVYRRTGVVVDPDYDSMRRGEEGDGGE